MIYVYNNFDQIINKISKYTEEQQQQTLFITSHNMKNRFSKELPGIIFVDLPQFIVENLERKVDENLLKDKTTFVIIAHILTEELAFVINCYFYKNIKLFLSESVENKTISMICANINVVSSGKSTVIAENIQLEEQEIDFEEKFVYLFCSSANLVDLTNLDKEHKIVVSDETVESSGDIGVVDTGCYTCIVYKKIANVNYSNFQRLVVVGNPFEVEIAVVTLDSSKNYLTQKGALFPVRSSRFIMDRIMMNIKEDLKSLEIYLDNLELQVEYSEEDHYFFATVSIPITKLFVTSGWYVRKKDALLEGCGRFIELLYKEGVLDANLDFIQTSPHVRMFITNFYKQIYGCMSPETVLEFKENKVQQYMEIIECEMMKKNNMVRFTEDLRRKKADGMFRRKFTLDLKLTKFDSLIDGFSTFKKDYNFRQKFCKPSRTLLYKDNGIQSPASKNKEVGYKLYLYKAFENSRYGILVFSKLKHVENIYRSELISVSYDGQEILNRKKLVLIEAFQHIFFKHCNTFSTSNLKQTYSFYYYAVPLVSGDEEESFSLHGKGKIDFEFMRSVTTNFLLQNVRSSSPSDLKANLLWNLKTRHFTIYHGESDLRLEDTINEGDSSYADFFEQTNGVQLEHRTGKGMHIAYTISDYGRGKEVLGNSEIVFLTSVPVCIIDDLQIFVRDFGMFVWAGQLDKFCKRFSLKPCAILVQSFLPTNSFTPINLERLEFFGDSVLKYVVTINLFNSIVIQQHGLHYHVPEKYDQSERSENEDSNIDTIFNLLRQTIDEFHLLINDYLCNQKLCKLMIEKGIDQYIIYDPAHCFFQPPNLHNFPETASFASHFGINKTFHSDSLNVLLSKRKLEHSGWSNDKGRKKKLLADVYEAVIGAIFVNENLEKAMSFLKQSKLLNDNDDHFSIFKFLATSTHLSTSFTFDSSTESNTATAKTVSNSSSFESSSSEQYSMSADDLCDISSTIDSVQEILGYRFKNTDLIKIIICFDIDFDEVSNISTQIKELKIKKCIVEILSIVGSALFHMLISLKLFEDERLETPYHLHNEKVSYTKTDSVSLIMKKYKLAKHFYNHSNETLSDHKLANMFYSLIGAILADLGGDVEKFKDDVYPLKIREYILSCKVEEGFKKAAFKASNKNNQ